MKLTFPKEEYPSKTLEKIGFGRRQCRVCGRFFWSKFPRDYCDDDECRVKLGLPAYGFLGKPMGKKLNYDECWKTFVSVFRKFGHTPIKRYPVLARWRDDVTFVEASIYDFQPYCVSGEVEPPANPLLVPQFCLRFNDLENVGVTGRHYSGFIMVGQHVFNRPGNFIYFKDEALGYLFELFTEGMGIPEENIFLHEDAWEGGGNAGPSIEFFVGGIELANQVYMQYKVLQDETGEKKLVELETKVIDMGAGLERFPWVLNGTKTSYEVVFPEALKYLENTKLSFKEKVILADHTRTLFIALFDGALPSNTGGGYNLRKILRQCFSILRKTGEKVDLVELMKIHSNWKIFPELKKADFKLIADIILEEEKKYKEMIAQGIQIVKKTEKFDLETLRRLYESNGITPEIIKDIKPEVEIPADFYAAREKKKERAASGEVFDTKGLPDTEKRYYEGETKGVAKVLRVIGDYVVLDRTVFYPRSGGQDCDLGLLNKHKVLEVIKQGNIVLHKIDIGVFDMATCPDHPGKCGLKEGTPVEMKVDKARRLQLTQHHTGAHIINGACRRVLGAHAQQAGAEKTVEKAHLDIYHYKKVTDEEVEEIERLANQCIHDGLDVIGKCMCRTDAEQKYGFEIYQGGAVPGKEIRTIRIGQLKEGGADKIDDWDAEACGGLHLKNTREAELIIITGVKKIQDAITRIEFVAGAAARRYAGRMEAALKECADVLGCPEDKVFEESEKLFEEWKGARKK
ncbi:MAG: alanine--tRNA ligase [Candidatus Aenigmarchaeota archaeon]|nr:alanine--tRNA ligase [Candidatus Aenigmarchaeota archaeon]